FCPTLLGLAHRAGSLASSAHERACSRTSRADERDVPMNETQILTHFVTKTTFADLPGRLVENLKITVLDTFSAALVGTRQPWAQRIVAVGRALGGAPEASVIHEGWRTDIARAAFANGVLIGAFECEPLTGSHASGTVLPAALAVCELERLAGVELLTAL